MGSGQWGSGQWAVGSGQWAVGSGQWAVGSGQWAVGSGQWAVDIEGILSIKMTLCVRQPVITVLKKYMQNIHNTYKCTIKYASIMSPEHFIFQSLV